MPNYQVEDESLLAGLRNLPAHVMDRTASMELWLTTTPPPPASTSSGANAWTTARRPPDVDVVQPLRLGDVDVEQRADELDAGVVDQDVEPAARALRDRVPAPRDDVRIGDVQREDLHVVAAQLLREVRGLGGVARRGEDVEAAALVEVLG